MTFTRVNRLYGPNRILERSNIWAIITAVIELKKRRHCTGRRDIIITKFRTFNRISLVSPTTASQHGPKGHKHIIIIILTLGP